MRRKLDETRNLLIQVGAEPEEEIVQGGVQFHCKGGESITHYNTTRKVVVRGTPTDLGHAVAAWADGDDSLVKALLGGQPLVEAVETAEASMVSPSKQVFIVYGRDTDARRDLQLLLHQMGLKPIVLGDLPAEGDTIIEKLEKYLGPNSPVGFACVLLTPDDEGYLKGQEDKKKYRARQNVILELGMVLTRLGRKRVAILRKGSVEKPSDIEGLIYLPFKERVDEVKSKLYQELTAAGYAPKVVT